MHPRVPGSRHDCGGDDISGDDSSGQSLGTNGFCSLDGKAALQTWPLAGLLLSAHLRAGTDELIKAVCVINDVEVGLRQHLAIVELHALAVPRLGGPAMETCAAWIHLIMFTWLAVLPLAIQELGNSLISSGGEESLPSAIAEKLGKRPLLCVDHDPAGDETVFQVQQNGRGPRLFMPCRQQQSRRLVETPAFPQMSSLRSTSSPSSRRRPLRHP